MVMTPAARRVLGYAVADLERKVDRDGWEGYLGEFGAAVTPSAIEQCRAGLAELLEEIA